MFPTMTLMGMSVAVTDTEALLDHVFGTLAGGRGGWIVTANLDILRRYVLDADARTSYAQADLRVADGMPLVWASRLAGRPLPERIAGSTLTGQLAGRAAAEGRTLFLLGGDQGAAMACRRALKRAHPDLRIVGVARPWVSSPATPEEVDAVAEQLGEPAPDLVLVGLGSPKQEHLIRALRAQHPERFAATWWMGVGITFSFVAGQVRRAPTWMQRTGLEWVHRMAQDPRRLARRYLLDGLPFAGRLAIHALQQRARRRLG